MGKLNTTDKDVLKRFRDTSVLDVVNPHYMDLSRGAIVVACSDGDQMDDLFSHLRDICKGSLDEARIHLLALNGGGLNLSTDWPTQEEGGILRKHLLGAKKLKGIETVILMSHAPCGMAGEYGHDIHGVIKHLMSAKSEIKKLDGSFKVTCFFHVDWHDVVESGKHKRNTYFVSRDRWQSLTNGHSAPYRVVQPNL